jgi:hypothetical protein
VRPAQRQEARPTNHLLYFHGVAERVDVLEYISYYNSMTNNETNNLQPEHDPLIIGELISLQDADKIGVLHIPQKGALGFFRRQHDGLLD